MRSGAIGDRWPIASCSRVRGWATLVLQPFPAARGLQAHGLQAPARRGAHRAGLCRRRADAARGNARVTAGALCTEPAHVPLDGAGESSAPELLILRDTPALLYRVRRQGAAPVRARPPLQLRARLARRAWGRCHPPKGIAIPPRALPSPQGHCPLPQRALPIHWKGGAAPREPSASRSHLGCRCVILLLGGTSLIAC